MILYDPRHVQHIIQKRRRNPVTNTISTEIYIDTYIIYFIYCSRSQVKAVRESQCPSYLHRADKQFTLIARAYIKLEEPHLKARQAHNKI